MSNATNTDVLLHRIGLDENGEPIYHVPPSVEDQAAIYESHPDAYVGADGWLRLS